VSKTVAHPLVGFLRKVAEDEHCRDLPDAELLRQCRAGRDEAAFRTLLRRHGPMVLDVCRNILGNDQDAEDAFQAVFLVLARQAGSIRNNAAVGSWLYGVAQRTAWRARRTRARRQMREAATAPLAASRPADELSWREVKQVMLEELDRLAERYRAPLVLCYLQNQTQDQAAQALGICRASLRKQLERGRALLQQRLIRRGLGPTAVLALVTWPATNSAASLPRTLVDATAHAAMSGNAALVSTRVATLTQGVLRNMFLHKLLKVATVVFWLTAVLTTAFAFGSWTRSDGGPQPAKVIAPQRAVTVLGAPAPARSPQDGKPAAPFVKWAAKDEFVGNEAHNPLVVQDKVIVGTDRGDLRAYRSSDGKLLWTQDYGTRIFHRPCSDGIYVYFIALDGLTAASIMDGSKVWTYTTSDGPTLVLAKHGLVYQAGDGGILHAVDTNTGKQVWTLDFVADAPPDPPNFPGEKARLQGRNARPSQLASDGETLFLSIFDQCRVLAVNARTGKRLWSFQARGWVFGSGVATEKHVFFGSQDKAFYCLDKETGNEIWKYMTKARIESGGAVDSRFVYFGSCDGGLYCLSQADGKEQWRFATDGKDGRASAIYSVPILKGGAVHFAAGDGQAYAVDQETGKLRWKIRPSEGSEVYCSLATDGRLFFLTTRRSGNNGEASLVAIGAK
jgi:RNA polymerase sigma factor (sigma-70 family)